ncbi:dTDP-4-dehydrorhamnose 3,5-epimerase family protein [Candidatus Gottesmanbacteria bacterium]|nr:dTDP-4-dehydrorhamnose 3,5-epimerase family protein [Candidatus Gottesmanbacteria bacterium]
MKPVSNQHVPQSKELRVSIDDRGAFVPFLSRDELMSMGLAAIKRIYYVANYGTGTIRGFHFHKKEWKYFTIVSGSAKFIAVNPQKPDTVYTFVSSVRKPLIIIVPPLYASGWVSLEPSTILLCASSATFDESVKDDVRYDPYSWGDVWSVKGR